LDLRTLDETPSASVLWFLPDEEPLTALRCGYSHRQCVRAERQSASGFELDAVSLNLIDDGLACKLKVLVVGEGFLAVHELPRPFSGGQSHRLGEVPKGLLLEKFNEGALRRLGCHWLSCGCPDCLGPHHKTR